MKTLADFKRKLVVGAKLDCTYHQAFGGRDEEGQPIWIDENKGIRKLSTVQTNSFAFETVKKNGELSESWCDMPSAKLSIIKENSITILVKDLRNVFGMVGKGNPQYDNAPLIPILTYFLT